MIVGVVLVWMATCALSFKLGSERVRIGPVPTRSWAQENQHDAALPFRYFVWSALLVSYPGGAAACLAVLGPLVRYTNLPWQATLPICVFAGFPANASLALLGAAWRRNRLARDGVVLAREIQSFLLASRNHLRWCLSLQEWKSEAHVPDVMAHALDTANVAREVMLSAPRTVRQLADRLLEALAAEAGEVGGLSDVELFHAYERAKKQYEVIVSWFRPAGSPPPASFLQQPDGVPQHARYSQGSAFGSSRPNSRSQRSIDRKYAEQEQERQSGPGTPPSADEIPTIRRTPKD